MPRTFTITDADREHADQLDDDTIRAILFDSEFAEASDGCTVYEPDGTCPHGRPNPLMVLGLI